LKDDAKHLIEKLGLAVLGEEPTMVIVVLATFVREVLDKYEIPLTDFVSIVLTTPPDVVKRDPD
jgi:hypothetical protein